MSGKKVMEKTLPKVVVVGSLNVDYTLRVPRIPAPGETLTASGMFSCFGGKGANQAIAAARAGAKTALFLLDIITTNTFKSFSFLD